MKFYGHGIVWDKTVGKALCRFVDGECDTDDVRVCDKLIAAGYKHTGKQPEMAVIAPEVPQKTNEVPKAEVVKRAPRKPRKKLAEVSK